MRSTLQTDQANSPHRKPRKLVGDHQYPIQTHQHNNPTRKPWGIHISTIPMDTSRRKLLIVSPLDGVSRHFTVTYHSCQWQDEHGFASLCGITLQKPTFLSMARRTWICQSMRNDTSKTNILVDGKTSMDLPVCAEWHFKNQPSFLSMARRAWICQSMRNDTSKTNTLVDGKTWSHI